MSEAAVRSEADDATRGSAVKLAAEVASRLLGAVTPFLVLKRLGASDFGAFGELSVYALLLAEFGELGLQNLASRALVAGSASLRSFVRARLVASSLVAAVALASVPLAPAIAGLAARLSGRPAPRLFVVDGVALALLVGWFALSGWGEFLGVALRCRRARRHEAVVLLVLRGAALAFAAAALVAGARLRGLGLALALSPLPALALAVALLRRTPVPLGAPSLPPGRVLRESAPLAVHGALLLLSPRVEFLVLSWLRHGSSEVGLFYAALNLVWPLAMVPTAVAAGAMPALTREAVSAHRPGSTESTTASVRRRTAATLALLGAPAGVGLALVAQGLSTVLLPAGSPSPEVALTAGVLRLAAAAVPALFLNALLAAALIAVGRSAWLPWLTATRVAAAFVLAFVLVPRLGSTGAAAGLVCAEWLLLGLGRAACRRARFAVPVGGPLAWSLLACLPMALAVNRLPAGLPLAIAVGGLTFGATLATVVLLRPALLRKLTGDLP